MSRKTIILTASGGGHTSRSKAIAEYLKDKFDILFIIPKGDNWSRDKVKGLGRVIEVVKARKRSKIMNGFSPIMIFIKV